MARFQMANDDVLIGPADLRTLFGDRDPVTAWRRTKKPGFPRPIMLPGTHGRRWWRAEVLAYIAAHQAMPAPLEAEGAAA
jgi:hypothetical protein